MGCREGNLEPAEKATVEGLVVEAGSRKALKKAQVTLTGGGRPWPASETSTNAEGRFLMANVEPGQYMLAAERNGYIRQVYGEAGEAEANIFLGPGTPLELEPGAHRRDIVFELVRAGVIAGRVLDEDHDPVPGAQVQAMHLVNMPGLPPWFPATNAAANDLGEYRLTGLRAGRYRVAACIPSPHPWPGGQSGALTYHPSVKDADQAPLVEVAAGGEVRDIDIVLLPVRTACIRGRVVVGSDRDGVPMALVRLMPQRPGFGGGGHVHGHTDQQGFFEVRGLMAGDYKIVADWQAGGKNYSGELALTVGDADVEGIELLLTSGASAGVGPLALAGLTLAGRLRVEGDAPISFPAWQVAVHPREPAGPGWGTRVAPDGSFLFHGGGALTLAETPASSYKISVSGPPSDFYLKSVLLGGKEVLETGFDLGAAESAPGSLELVLAGDGGRIDGVVLDDQQRPAGGARVVLVPEPVCHGPDHMFNASLSAYNGRFTLRGIVPGDYRLCALEARWLGSFAVECEREGKRCHVEPSSRQTLSLRLIRKDESASRP